MTTCNRRRFLKAAAAGGVAYAMGHTPDTVFAQMAGGGQFTDYKALVCVFLFGGNDSWNMVVPYSQAEYTAYANSRQSLAIDRAALLQIQPDGAPGATHGFHPNMSGLRDLFVSGRCAVVANVGPMVVEPTQSDKQLFQAGSLQIPPQLFSHNDQQDQWHSLKGRAQSRTGWAGRVADVLANSTTAQQLALNVSLSGQTLYQAGEQAVPYTMGASGPAAFESLTNANDPLSVARRNAFTSIVNAGYGSIYERGFAEVQKRALQFSDRVNSALEFQNANNPLVTAFPSSNLGTQLRTVARLIAARDRLQMTRQIFFVATGGFDSHDNQAADQPGLLGGVSSAMKAFYDATVELGVSQSVTSFTQSDFGRTLTSNGDGSDHAWGGIQLVVGDAVQGRRFYGAYPSLAIGSERDVGGGRFIPSVSSDQYAATLAKWLGVQDGNLNTIAPSLSAFSIRDLGFMI
jgi:uncharacterized protein (DUF1501 family)